MSEEEIKSLRFSFTNPYREDLPKHKVNQFGHTILSDSDDFKPVDMDIEVDQNGDITANPKLSILDSDQFSKLVQSHLDKNENQPEYIETVVVQPDLLSKLISELDELKEEKEFPWKINPDGSYQIDKNTTASPRFDLAKNCANKDCMYALPQDAKFCLKCGTAQMPKFCTECGFSFSAMEKFCPDCGTKR
jgi:predicted  nucleic acid-binding Zn-ribbon protein